MEWITKCHADWFTQVSCRQIRNAIGRARLPKPTVELIDLYVCRFQRRIAGSNRFLFPGRKGNKWGAPQKARSADPAQKQPTAPSESALWPGRAVDAGCQRVRSSGFCECRALSEWTDDRVAGSTSPTAAQPGEPAAWPQSSAEWRSLSDCSWTGRSEDTRHLRRGVAGPPV